MITAIAGLALLLEMACAGEAPRKREDAAVAADLFGSADLPTRKDQQVVIADSAVSDQATPDANAGPCQSGESPFGGKCYRVITGTDMSYDAAKTACSGQQAKLVTIESAGEDAFVYGILPSSVSGAWIGLKRTGSGQSTWIWENGASPGYTNWGPTEPNNENGVEDCVLLWGPGLSISNLRAKWNDAPCDTPLRDTAICER